MRPDGPAWVLPLGRFNNIPWIDARVEAAPPEACSGLRNALRYLYVDDGPRNLELYRFRKAEPHLDEAEQRAARWMRTRTNGSGRKQYGTGSIDAARRARFRCEDCGHDDVRTLQIDHVDGRKGETDLQCLCANCHQIKSHADSAKRNASKEAVVG